MPKCWAMWILLSYSVDFLLLSSDSMPPKHTAMNSYTIKYTHYHSHCATIHLLHSTLPFSLSLCIFFLFFAIFHYFSHNFTLVIYCTSPVIPFHSTNLATYIYTYTHRENKKVWENVKIRKCDAIHAEWQNVAAVRCSLTRFNFLNKNAACWNT